MKTNIQGLLAVVVFALPMVASATVVTWELRGSITGFSGQLPAEYAGAAVGDSFQILFSFDTDAALIRTDQGGRFDPGARYVYDPSSMSATVAVGNGGPVDYAVSDPDPANSLLYMRDDSGDLLGVLGYLVDGFSIGIGSISGEVFNLVLRGSVLDIIDGPALPAVPDPRLADLEDSGFAVRFFDSSGEVYALAGDVTSVQAMAASPEELVSDLISSVVNLNLQSGIGNALDSKLQNALDALDRAQAGDTASAVGILHAFIQSVEAQRGKSLTDAQADELVASAQAIIDALSQP